MLRLSAGASVELFDDAGFVAAATIETCDRDRVIARVGHVDSPRADRFQWTIASAVPKGDRADWMIEKLSELGAAAFTPLATARSVVLPEGKNKRDRWQRIATESAKQSRRVGVMRIDELTPLTRAISAATSSSVGWFLSTEDGAIPVADAIASLPRDLAHLLMFIGPEGGWTDEERSGFTRAGLTPVALTTTILRVETAAVAAAAIVASLVAPPRVRHASASPQGEP